MAEAALPPVESYTFFLKSLLETVRINIGECAAASYSVLTIEAATKILMFQNETVCEALGTFTHIYFFNNRSYHRQLH